MTVLALAITDASGLDRLAAPPEFAGITAGRLHFGGEFCETLLPTAAGLKRALAAAETFGLAFTLATPIVSDAGLARLDRLLPLLPPGTEVTANDWGFLRRLRDHFPDLVPTAGRLLCKQVKDPRLPSAEWTRLQPHGIHAPGFTAMLARLGCRRIEMDVAPFATEADFHSPSMAVSVHAPFGFTTKGRSCRIGSLALPTSGKFAIGHDCRKECLRFQSAATRPDAATADLATVQRGNTLFYRHATEMAATLRAAAAAGAVERVILAGDWP